MCADEMMAPECPTVYEYRENKIVFKISLSSTKKTAEQRMQVSSDHVERGCALTLMSLYAYAYYPSFLRVVRKKLNVQAYHGGEGGDGNDMEGVNVAICTMEKANSIVNRLAEEKRLQVRYKHRAVSSSREEPVS